MKDAVTEAYNDGIQDGLIMAVNHVALKDQNKPIDRDRLCDELIDLVEPEADQEGESIKRMVFTAPFWFWMLVGAVGQYFYDRFFG
jgi:hypothetical protein